MTHTVSDDQFIPTVRISGWEGDRVTGARSITISGLTTEEERAVGGVAVGQSWMKVGSEGRIEFRSVHNPLPGPTDDVDMLPFWRRSHPGDAVIKAETFANDNLNHYNPSLIIQHLCGYHYTPESYRQVARNLEKWGFECLRSRRGAEGRFWELWFLSDLFFAEGKLKAVIGQGNVTTKVKIERAVRFLCENSSFGSLDVCVQRAAMVVERE